MTATYKTTGSNINSIALVLAEHIMYGSSRLGQVTREQDMDQAKLPGKQLHASWNRIFVYI